MKANQQHLIAHLREELGVSEDTEHLLDWLQDAWTTLDILCERFGEARALYLYTASVSLSHTSDQEPILV